MYIVLFFLTMVWCISLISWISSLYCSKYDDDDDDADDILVIYGSFNINMDIYFIKQGTAFKSAYNYKATMSC